MLNKHFTECPWLHQNHASLTTTSFLEVYYCGMATERRTCRKDSSLVSARASRKAMKMSIRSLWKPQWRMNSSFVAANSWVFASPHCCHQNLTSVADQSSQNLTSCSLVCIVYSSSRFKISPHSCWLRILHLLVVSTYSTIIGVHALFVTEGQRRILQSANPNWLTLTFLEDDGNPASESNSPSTMHKMHSTLTRVPTYCCLQRFFCCDSYYNAHTNYCMISVVSCRIDWI